MTSQCMPCEVGFYQSMPNQYYCEPCGADRTTTGTGSDNVNDCFGQCRRSLTFSVVYRPKDLEFIVAHCIGSLRSAGMH